LRPGNEQIRHAAHADGRAQQHRRVFLSPAGRRGIPDVAWLLFAEDRGREALNASTSIKDWLGRTRRDEDEVTVGAARRLAATLDRDPAALQRGDALPESWYAILFGPVALQHTLGPDGHPKSGDFLPPLAGMRRVFGGRRTRFVKPLRIGDEVARVSTVTGVEHKSGRSGPLTLVTVTHAVSGPSGLAITEEQDIVYRAAAGAAAPQRKAESVPSLKKDREAEWSKALDIDPVLVFRYSALTFNGHRIHYDLPYTRDVEGYPALLMNGGLTALMLIETARPHLPRPIAGYAARASSPLFVGQRVSFNGRLASDGAQLWASGPDGGPAYEVELTLAESALADSARGHGTGDQAPMDAVR
jgi:3-methylfumaryl-CoA hydratase